MPGSRGGVRGRVPEALGERAGAFRDLAVQAVGAEAGVVLYRGERGVCVGIWFPPAPLNSSSSSLLLNKKI